MTTLQAETIGTFALGGDLTINRLGYGAMRLTGPGIWEEPKDRNEARKVLQRAIELGVMQINIELQCAANFGAQIAAARGEAAVRAAQWGGEPAQRIRIRCH